MIIMHTKIAAIHIQESFNQINHKPKSYGTKTLNIVYIRSNKVIRYLYYTLDQCTRTGNFVQQKKIMEEKSINIITYMEKE